MSTFYKPESGQIVGGYKVNKELGEGRFSYVVSGSSPTETLAIKIYRSDRESLDCYKTEIKILLLISKHPNIVNYLGTFAVVDIIGFTPNIHPVVIFEQGGPTISDLIRYCNDTHGSNIPVEHTKKIMRGIFSGLDHIHKVGLIHADIKPSNVLLDRPIEIITGTDFEVKIVDFGSTMLIDEADPAHVGTVGYLAPEMILSNKIYTASDVWSAFMSCFRMITGEHMLDIFDDADMFYGDDVYTDPIDYDEDESDYDDEDDYLVNYKTLVLLEKLLGPAEKHVRKKAKKYYNARQKLKNNIDISPITIGDFIRLNFEIDDEVIDNLVDFLMNGLRYNPESRVTAAAALDLPWLK